MSLKDIFCQDRAISILQRAFAVDKVPHAYIFAGLGGVGKFKTAREWAKLLLCKKPIEDRIQRLVPSAVEGTEACPEHTCPERGRGSRRDRGQKTEAGGSLKADGFGDGGEPGHGSRGTRDVMFADSCGSCQSCQYLEAGSHPDFNHVYKELIQFTKEGKGKKTPVDLPIDVVREFLIEKVTTRPTVSQRKVFVVSEAEKLNAASQNCLLKVLEEPPQYCCIILLCTRLERLLPTTKSRCQTIRFGPVDEPKIIEKLKEIGLEEEQAQYFARLAQGSLGQGCQWAKLELANANLYQTKKKLVTSLVRCEFAGALDLAQELLGDSKAIANIWADLDETTSKTDINRRAQKTLIQIIISVFHDVMKLNVTPAPLEIPECPGPLPAESRSKEGKFLPVGMLGITEQAKTLINFDQQEQVKKLAGRFDPEQAAEKIAHCYRTLRWIDSAVNERLIFEQLLLNLVGSDIMKV